MSRNQLFLYANSELTGEKLRKNPSHNCFKKYIRINLTKEVKPVLRKLYNTTQQERNQGRHKYI